MTLLDELAFVVAAERQLLLAIAMVTLLTLYARLAWARMDRDRMRAAAAATPAPSVSELPPLNG
jgi:hypothetical protein